MIILSYFFRKKCKLRFAKISNSFKKLLKISALGFSAFIVEISFGITSVVFNNVIMERLSSVHLAIFGTASSVLIMFYCFFYAVGTALQPIVSANYGASAIPRVKKTLHIAIIYALALGAAFTLVSQLMPETILNIFMDTTPQIMKIGPNILRMYTLSLPIVGVSILSTYYFQSILRGSLAVVISLLRGIVFPIAFVFALPMIFDISSIWFAVPLSECITCAFAILFFCRTGRDIEAEKLSQIEL